MGQKTDRQMPRLILNSMKTIIREIGKDSKDIRRVLWYRFDKDNISHVAGSIWELGLDFSKKKLILHNSREIIRFFHFTDL